MLSPLDACWLQLPPSKSYARRFCYWVPGCSFINRDNDGRQYGCSMHQQSGWRSGNKITRDQYQVEFAGLVPGAMAYQFLWEHLDPPQRRQGERIGPYIVTVGPHLHDCDCQAGACRVLCCRHRSACIAAIAEGLVDGAEAWEGICDPGSAPDFYQPGDDVFKSGKWIEDEVLADA